jgi:hypothetical protein
MLAVLAVQASVEPRTWKGRWSATAGGREVGGTWTARDYGDAQESGGRWEVLSQDGRVLLSGTWNARRLPAAWSGSWAARILTGGSYEGTWAARLAVSPKLPLVEMFQLLRKGPVTGTWTESRGRRGSWTIWAD